MKEYAVCESGFGPTGKICLSRKNKCKTGISLLEVAEYNHFKLVNFQTILPEIILTANCQTKKKTDNRYVQDVYLYVSHRLHDYEITAQINYFACFILLTLM